MVGGVVIEAIELPGSIWVNCRGTGSERNDTCAVLVERNDESRFIQPGDKFWWQSGWAFWTPSDGTEIDKKIPRLSSSGIGRPPGR
jgi:hypothetical protein